MNSYLQLKSGSILELPKFDAGIWISDSHGWKTPKLWLFMSWHGGGVVTINTRAKAVWKKGDHFKCWKQSKSASTFCYRLVGYVKVRNIEQDMKLENVCSSTLYIRCLLFCVLSLVFMLSWDFRFSQRMWRWRSCMMGFHVNLRWAPKFRTNLLPPPWKWSKLVPPKR
jgi:hypothetical protein